MREHDGIRAENLVKRYGERAVVDGVDLTVEPGSMLALLGPNGAGKTTTLRMLTTLTRPDGGSATVGGHDVVADPLAVRRVIGVTGQDTTVDGLLTGLENLVMFGRLFGLDPVMARRRAGELLDEFGLGEAGGRQVMTYSGGMRRRLDLAVGLVGRPRIVFLDEPTTGLDPVGRGHVWTIVRRLMDEGGTVLLTTQNLEEADRLADRIAVIDSGRVIAEGTPQSLKSKIGSERAELTFATPAESAAAFSTLDDTDPIAVTSGRIRVPLTDAWHLHSILGRLQAAGLRPESVTVAQPTLDDVFFAVTGANVDQRAPKELS